MEHKVGGKQRAGHSLRSNRRGACVPRVEQKAATGVWALTARTPDREPAAVAASELASFDREHTTEVKGRAWQRPPRMTRIRHQLFR